MTVQFKRADNFKIKTLKSLRIFNKDRFTVNIGCVSVIPFRAGK